MGQGDFSSISDGGASPRVDPVRFVRYQSHNDNEPEPVANLPLEVFFAFLGEHEEGEKDGASWAPHWIEPGDLRRKVNVQTFDVFAIDLDHMDREAFDGIRDRLKGTEHLLYTTHSYRPDTTDGDGNFVPGDYCARVVFSLSRRLLVSEFSKFLNAVARTYDCHPDKRARDPSRLFYMPRCPVGAPRINEYGPGAPLDVDGLLAASDRFLREDYFATQRQVQSRPVVEGGAVDQTEIRKTLRWYVKNEGFGKPEHAEWVRRVLDKEPLQQKPGRDEACNTLGWILGCFLPIGTPPEVVNELVHLSITTIESQPDDEAHETTEFWFKKILYGFERGAQETLKRQAERGNNIAKLKLMAKSHKSSSSVPALPPTPTASLPTPTASPAASPASLPVVDEEDESWLELLHVHPKTGLPLPTFNNVGIVFRHHSAWKHRLRFNELTKDVECVGGPIAIAHHDPSRLLAAAQDWMQDKRNELCITVNDSVMKSQLLHVARDNAYDPIREYLFNLVWDGKPRIASFLADFCRAELVDDAGNDVSEFVSMVSERWFIGAINRALHPGCKMDNVLVLEGEEERKKSMVFDVLGGAFFSDSRISLDDKDSKLLAARTWIVELAELGAMKRTESEIQKAFLSARHDDFRVPYAPAVERFPRRCVFVGTTNEETYLPSMTGNRRFWPVKCNRVIDIDRVRQFRDQLWAEAVAKMNKRYWFEPNENEKFRSITEARLTDHENLGSVQNTILGWWRRQKDRPREFHMDDILVAAFKFELAKLADAKGLRNRIGRVLVRIGFQRKKVREAGEFFWRYFATPELLSMPHVPGAGHLRLVAGAKAETLADGPMPPEGEEGKAQ